MKTLLVGYKASDLTPQLLEGDVTCHVLDIYHRHAIEKVHHAKVVCSAHLPEGPWDVVKFKTGPKLMSGEVALDLLQEIAALVDGHLKPPRFVLDYVGRERDRNDLMDKLKDWPKRVRSFAATWPASVPGGEPLTFTSFPGCFCHRRLDEGGLALAEVACRDLCQQRIVNSEKGITLLDMGCGCGLVGLLIAHRLTPHEAQGTSHETQGTSHEARLTLVGVDSHSRAIEAAELNAKAFGIPAEFILADNGSPARLDGTFDVFVGNPPYYSDYRIADVFLETAKRALKPGGVCYTVCKNADGLKPVQERYFPQVEILKRRNYAVLKSVKEN